MSVVLMTLRDKDVFPNAPEVTDVIWKDRQTAKVVLFNEKNDIALVSNKVTSLFLLPGGGIEEGETPVEGAERECREETGYDIEIIRALGVTEDYRARVGRHSISHCFAAKAISRGSIALTESESDIGFFVQCFSVKDAVNLLASQEEKVRRGEVEFYNTCFNIMRDSFFIRHAQQLLG